MFGRLIVFCSRFEEWCDQHPTLLTSRWLVSRLLT
jgi:hypothetical protein